MTSLDLLTIFGGIENQYLLEAQTLRSRTAPAHRLHWKRAIVMLAAVVALMTLLCGTAMAVSTDFREYVFDIFGFFFPPKTAAIVIDGTEEEIRYSSLGEVTDEVGLGFAIYTDYGNYSMTEENGIYCIRPTPSENSEDTASPDCELVIVHTDGGTAVTLPPAPSGTPNFSAALRSRQSAPGSPAPDSPTGFPNTRRLWLPR